jgi:hypothetical protein
MSLLLGQHKNMIPYRITFSKETGKTYLPKDGEQGGTNWCTPTMEPLVGVRCMYSNIK